ncbi:MAG: tRNA (N(6)-L-threonylcarbamoyladenosine(37)-C(2))-methylthiotransferase MtaB [Oscillospiraceae bacterium]|nr:tRNA (N(6)-L-threonylcarbamoyladenosine(37)-C(2))-methylthiotransferase MtaB [Oscillospiraceae bacterium]
MPDKKFSAGVCTLGCRVNQYESECVITGFADAGFEIKDFGDVCDVYVINTCAVTAGSDKKSKQMIRRAKKQNKNAVIAVCGCFSQNKPEAFKTDLSADIVVGTSEKTKIPKLALDILNGIRPENNILVKNAEEYTTYENMSAGRSTKTRAYIKIQDGCDYKCSYCIIPSLRGASRSREYGHILAEAKHFDQIGCREIVLTGIEISSYGKDFKDKNFDLAKLLEQLDAEPKLNNISSIRLSSVDPSLVKRDFIDRFASLKKMANHFHLSLQSGSTAVLSAMRRKYSAETAVKNIEYARQKIKGLNLTADMIVGFPGETDEDFEKSIAMVKLLDIYHAHIFKYSKRENTKAAKFAGQISENLKNYRSGELSKACVRIKEKIHRQNLGGEFDVIIENMTGGYYTAKTKNFFDVKIKAGRFRPPPAARIKIFDCDKDYLYGEIVDNGYADMI